MDAVAAEPRAEGADAGRRSPVDQAAPAPRVRTSAEAVPTVVDGALKRDQAPVVQAKTAPAPPPPPPQSAEQAASVLRQFRLQLTPGMRQATIQLQPAALGRIAIRISLRNGEARTEIRAESAEALEALERHVPELRAALQNQGIEPGEIDLALGFGGDDKAGSGLFDEPSNPETSDHQEASSILASKTVTRSLLSETGVDTYA